MENVAKIQALQIAAGFPYVSLRLVLFAFNVMVSFTLTNLIVSEHISGVGRVLMSIILYYFLVRNISGAFCLIIRTIREWILSILKFGSGLLS